MANEIRLKRRASTGSAGAPSALKNAEPAFNEADKVLYLGFGDDGSGAATSIISIGGEGAFATLTTTQSLTGDKTFSGTVGFTGNTTATTPAAGDNSTLLATTAFVNGEVSGLSQTISVSADTGSGSADLKNDTVTVVGGTGLSSTWDNTAKSITLAIDNTAVTAATYGAADKVGTFTVDAQGRLTAASDATIDIVHTQVNDFDAGVQANRLDQMAAPTANVSLNSQKITGLADPTADSDAANKGYVDSVAQGLDVKASCKLATTTNITLSGTSNGIDGQSISDGDRVLVKDQTDASENGIYVVASGAWSRATDFDDSASVTPGSFVFVEQGNTQADNGYVMVSDGTVTVGTSDINFEQFSGAGQITAGDGLQKSGNTLSADLRASGGLVIEFGELAVDLSASSITGTLAVGDGGTGVTTITGLVKGNGTSAFTAAIDETDYLSPNAEIDGGTF